MIDLEGAGVGHSVLIGGSLFAFPLESLLHLLRCSSLRFARRSTNFALREVAKRLERLADRQTFKSIVLDRCQVLAVGEAEFGARKIALGLQFSCELVTLLVGKRFDSSGLSIDAFCLQEDVGHSQFSQWLLALRGPAEERDSRSGEGAAFVPLMVKPQFIEILLPGGGLVRLSASVDRALLMDVIGLVSTVLKESQS